MASDGDLIDALPEHVILYTCQWDFLFREGEDFRERLLEITGRGAGGVGSAGSGTRSTDPEHIRKRRTTTVEPEKEGDKKDWGREASLRNTRGKGERRGNTIDVRGGIIPQAVHAWDKNSPLEYLFDPGKKKMTSVTAFYEDACRELQRALTLSGAGD